MRRNFVKRLISFTMSAVMMFSLAAVSTYASTEVTNWGYEVDFDDIASGCSADSSYVSYSNTVTASGTDNYMKNGTVITVNKFPKKKVVVQMDVATEGYSWFRLYKGSDHSQMAFAAYNADEAGSHTVVLEYAPTDSDAAETFFTIEHGTQTNVTIDNVKIYIDGENLQPNPTYELNLNDYSVGDSFFLSSEYFVKAGIAVDGTDTEKYFNIIDASGSPKPVIWSSKLPSKKMIVEAEVAGHEGKYSLMTVIQYSDTSATTWADEKGRVTFGTDRKIYRTVINASDINATAQSLSVAFMNTKVYNIKIWCDGEEATAGDSVWGYEEDFESYAADVNADSTYVSYSNKVTSDGTNSYMKNGTVVTINKFPQKKAVVQMDVTTEGYSWFRLYNGSGTQMAFTAYNADEAGSHTVLLEYIPQDSDASQTYFTIQHGTQTNVTIDNVKIYVDGENLKPAPTFDMDLTKYDVGETISVPDVVTLSKPTVYGDSTKKYLQAATNSDFKMTFDIPDTRMMIEAEVEKFSEETSPAVYIEGYDKDANYLGRFIHYGGISGTTWKWSLDGNSVYESGDTVKGKKLSETATSYVIVTPCYVNITDLKIWYDGIEAPAVETWEGYTPYTYMTDFEADNVGTTPTSEFITFNGSVTEDKELYGVENAAGTANSNIITLNKIPQKNFIMSMDMRLATLDRGEDLQLWMFGTPGALIARHQNTYFEDLNNHTYVIVGDMINKKINVYIDGVLTSNIERAEDVENWKTTMSNNAITYMNFQFVNVYIDNLKVDIDTEKLYTGGYIADTNGNKLQTLTSGQTVKGAVYGASYLRNDNPAQMIMALYEVKEDGTLYFIDHDVTDINGNRGGKIMYSDEFTVGTLEAGKTYCIKQFIWDSVDDMNPLTLVAEIFTVAAE